MQAASTSEYEDLGLRDHGNFWPWAFYVAYYGELFSCNVTCLDDLAATAFDALGGAVGGVLVPRSSWCSLSCLVVLAGAAGDAGSGYAPRAAEIRDR